MVMPDMDKVIKGMACCVMYCDAECPYHGGGCSRALIADAMVLLREQERQIKRLEYDLAIAESSLRYYTCGND